MRFSFLVALIFLTVISAFSQEKYHIIHVKGNIKIKSTGKVLQPKDVVSANDEIVFGSSTDMAAAISSEKGRMILRPNPAQASKGELTAFVSNIIELAGGKLSTRGILNTFLDLQNYFNSNHVFLDGKASIEINTSEIPMNAQNFFFLRYNYNGEEINKKLSFTDNKLHFIESEIYSVDGKPIDQTLTSNHTLYYFEAEWKTSRKIGEFNPVFPENNALLTELAIIKEIGGTQKEADKWESEVEAYIQETYGKIIPADFAEWKSTYITK